MTQSLCAALIAGLVAALGLVPAYASDDVPLPDPVAETEQPLPTPMPATKTPPTFPFNEGKRGDRIGALHDRLTWLGGSISAESRKLKRYGKSTTKAVRAMQTKYGLVPSGTVDRRTWNALVNLAPKPGTLPQRCRTGLVVCIDKTTKVVRLVRDGATQMTLDARFGRAGYETREGTFRVTRKSRDHVSNTYHVWMPFALFFAGGQAVHYSPTFRRIGHVSGSHGCVNLRDIDDARALFDRVPVGSTVVVYRS